jgi:hypothetical protein
MAFKTYRVGNIEYTYNNDWYFYTVLDDPFRQGTYMILQRKIMGWMLTNGA